MIDNSTQAENSLEIGSTTAMIRWRLVVSQSIVLSIALYFGNAIAWSQDVPMTKISEWNWGVLITSPLDEKMKMYLWFYEWNMFDARSKGEHTGGSHQHTRTVTPDHRKGTITSTSGDLRLLAEATPEGAVLTLTITNRSNHDWPDVAGIIPCFNPGPDSIRNRQFANTNTYYYGLQGLTRLVGREIHFNERMRPSLDRIAPNGRFVFSQKWPTSKINAKYGILIRESDDGKWVTGIAWEDFLSAQGHNPWECMHLAVRVGALPRGETKKVRGRMLLFQGSKEECLDRLLKDLAAQ